MRIVFTAFRHLSEFKINILQIKTEELIKTGDFVYPRKMITL